jgi:hypothetical protein
MLSFTGVFLLLSGAFAIFLATQRHFLPHDTAYLGMDAKELCQFYDCRIVKFMFHDRVAFGGSLIAIGILYLWLVADPLRNGERWAWNTIATSGAMGFMSFLAYLGYGYLDTWHGIATLALLPFFLIGLGRTRRLASKPSARSRALSGEAHPQLRLGRWLLLATAAGVVAAGATSLVVGMNTVFVPQDLHFMHVDPEALQNISPRLIPLIAHDRAGFGGGLVATGIIIAFCGWYAPGGRAFRQAIAASGLAGFGCAIGVHFVEGYVDWGHLAPAIIGAIAFLLAAGLETSGVRELR